MKRIVVITIAVILSLPFVADAQNITQTRREALLEYNQRRRKDMLEYRDNYRRAVADYMRKRWEAVNVERPMAMPQRKEPVEPVVKRPTATTQDAEERIATEEIIDLRTPATTEQPTIPKPIPQETTSKPVTPNQPKRDTKQDMASAPKPAVNTSRALPFMFYGTECSVSLNSTHRIRLASLQENVVAAEWEKIASGKYDTLVGECLDIKKALTLNDWGYYMLVRNVCDKFCGEGSNESVLLQSFLMSEAGYKMRLARGDNRLCLLLAVDTRVYAKPYFTISGDTFYLLDNRTSATSYNICNFSIPGERELSMTMHNLPQLSYRAATPMTRSDSKTQTSVMVTPNANLADFMSDYPACSWEVYAATKLSESTAVALYPTLGRMIEGKSDVEAVGLLMSFMHNAFPYKTDPQQFGSERTLFAEEMFVYKYSDCEDRSILFARLVKELVGLDVILLNYPDHIATAVHFNESVKGDYVELRGERYTVCDATYIGSKVGEAMPEFRGVSAKIIRVN